MNTRLNTLFTLVALAALTVGTAPAHAAYTDVSSDAVAIDDPYEQYNRYVFDFNQGADRYVFRPIASGYRYITPDPIRDRLGNFSDNLNEPLSFVNSMFQGDFERGMKTFWRFVINSTFGIGGLNDVATSAGIPQQEEDFGQTLAVWGVGPGDYFVLPLLGPSDGRDIIGKIGDYGLNPVTWALWDEGWAQFGVGAGQAIVAREQLLDPIDDINESSLDPYATYRSIYLQRREAQIRNRSNDDMPNL